MLAFFLSPSLYAVNFLSVQTEDEKNNIKIFQQARRSVVYVVNSKLSRDLYSFNVMEVPQGTGSGIIWNNEGLVITNYHVIQGAEKVKIILADSSTWPAKVVGLAPSKDLALLKIEASAERLNPLPLGNSGELVVGRKVLAIGNPFGLDFTLTVGVVSALDREIAAVDGERIQGMIQTDAAINPGNSGGPLLNSLGQLVGVNTAIYSPSGASVGIGFAIPINTVKKIIPQLAKYGRVYKPIMGIETFSDSWANQFGIKGVPVYQVISGGPAANAGMIGVQRDHNGAWKLGDIIVAINEERIFNNEQLYDRLAQQSVGDQIVVDTIRQKKRLRFKLQLVTPESLNQQ